eukprot:comp16614_c0_seq1/m.14775 comp16614_c0_seq1/g.14775  ORF comp16614_c0_seq1/g.14775 comp16614_c0_seq1/m.14775 type:complete len:266 (-) comp16614_c0_seq1:83-880(-)
MAVELSPSKENDNKRTAEPALSEETNKRARLDVEHEDKARAEAVTDVETSQSDSITSNSQATSAVSTQEGKISDELAAKGVRGGARLKVLWDVEEDGDDEKEEVLFTCVLSECKGFDAEGRPVFVASYEPLREFPACEREVCFEQTGELWDTVDKDHLRWALEGEEEALFSEENETYTIDQVLKASEEGEEGNEEDLEKEAMNEFSKMPHDKQTALAHGFRDFADFMKERLYAIAAKHGPDYAISKDDIDGIMEEFMAKKVAGTV